MSTQEKTKRFIIEYRGEFSTVVEAKNVNAAMKKAQTQECEWECIGELHPCFFEHQTDHLTEDELYALCDG